MSCKNHSAGSLRPRPCSFARRYTTAPTDENCRPQFPTGRYWVIWSRLVRPGADKSAVAVADPFAKHAVFRYRQRVDALPDDDIHARGGVRSEIMRADIDDMHAAFDPAAFDHRIHAV